MKKILMTLILILTTFSVYAEDEETEPQQLKPEIERIAEAYSADSSNRALSGNSRVYFFDGGAIRYHNEKLDEKVEGLGKKLREEYPNVMFSYQHNMTWDQVCEELKGLKLKDRPEHLVLIGHSYGASGAMSVAHCINPMHVDLVITLDGHTWPGRKPADLVPENVAFNYNYFETLDLMVNPLPIPHNLQGYKRGHREDDTERGITNQKINLKLFKDVSSLLIQPHYEIVQKVFKAGMIDKLVESALKNELVSGLMVEQ